MSNDLRRLASDPTRIFRGSTILALLDKVRGQEHNLDRMNGLLHAAERRVAALEAERDGLLVRLGQCAERAKAAEREARALLAAAPSEPRPWATADDSPSMVKELHKGPAALPAEVTCVCGAVYQRGEG